MEYALEAPLLVLLKDNREATQNSHIRYLHNLLKKIAPAHSKHKSGLKVYSLRRCSLMLFTVTNAKNKVRSYRRTEYIVVGTNRSQMTANWLAFSGVLSRRKTKLLLPEVYLKIVYLNFFFQVL